MKKGLVATLVLGLALMLAAPAMAIDWSASGYIAITGNAFKNATWQQKPQVPGPPGVTNTTHFDEQGAYIGLRNRLMVTARADKDLYGVMYFEIDSGRFGTLAEAGVGEEHAGVWGADETAVEVKNVYIDFKIPQIPVWIRPGIQGYVLRPALFLFRDGAGVSARVKIDPMKMNITGMYGKMRDPDTWDSFEGAELYVFDMNLPIGPLKVGGHFTFENVRGSADLGSAGGVFGAAGADSAKLWWLGAYANGKIGPVKTEADFIYNGGKADMPVGSDVDYGSWLLRLLGSVVFGNLEAGLGFMYVQGEDFGDADVSTFVLPGLVSEGCAICGDSIVFHTGWMGTDPGALAPGFIGPDNVWVGHWYLRAFAMYQVLEWMKLGAQVAYFGDTNKDGDVFDPYPGSAVDPEDDDYIGVELDIGTNITIYKNLSFRGGFGYMFAGDALKMWSGTAWEKPADPWVFVGTLLYTF